MPYSGKSKEVLPPEKSPNAITAKTGPTEQSETKPKLFSPAFLPPILCDMPMPSAIMNGTVIGPVVTPPLSKASGMKSAPPFSAKIAVKANKHI